MRDAKMNKDFQQKAQKMQPDDDLSLAVDPHQSPTINSHLQLLSST